MRYLFADATPFPLNENFLATLCAATDACVAILKADDAVDETNHLIGEAEAKASQEQLHLIAVAQRVEDAFGAEGKQRKSNSVSESAFGRIGELAWRTIAETKSEISRQREASIAGAVAASPRAHVLPALSAFLAQHQVPDTSWGIRWQAGGKSAPTKAELYARTPFGLELTFDVAMPSDHLFARPVSASLLEQNAIIHLLTKPFMRKPRPMPVRLDSMYVTAVSLTPERASMVLKGSGTKPSEGVEILLDSEGSRDVTITRIDRAGYPCAQSERLSPTDAATVHRLWSKVVATIATLLPYRRQATKATFGGVGVSEVARPSVIAEAIIFCIAPLVREVARRTATPGELALKRFLGDGCREEIFITYDTVVERTSGLSDRHLAKFDPFGLRSTRSTMRPIQGTQPVISELPTPAQLPAPARLPVVHAPPISHGPPPMSHAAPQSARQPITNHATMPPPAMPAPTAPPPPMGGVVHMLPNVRPPKPRAVAS